MIKGAQRKSMDPVQQRLRQSKATWNKEVSTFINDVIHLKKLMNGWPNKFHKERSRITEPIPADPATILGSLAGDFQEIAQRGNALIQQQIQYSQNRRKPQPKTPEAPTAGTPATPATPAAAPAPAADLTKQLAASFEAKYGLVAEGSNPLSRFLARVTTPRIGFGQKAQERRLRMDLLKSSIKTYRALGRLQVEVSKSSKQSVVSSYKQMKAAWDQWSVVSRNFKNYINTLPTSPSAAPKAPVPSIPDMKDEPQPGEEREEEDLSKPWENFALVSKIISDYRGYGHLFDKEDEGQLNDLGNTIYQVMKVPKPQKIFFAQKMEDQYQKAINSINAKLGTTGDSLKAIYQELNKKKKELEKIPPSQRPFKASDPYQPTSPNLLPDEYSASDQLEVVAQAFLQKWLGKMRHQALPGKSSGIRLQIFELATSARQNINKAMDILEKSMDIQTLAPIVATATQQMDTIRSLMRSLYNTEKPQGKGSPPGEGGFF